MNGERDEVVANCDHLQSLKFRPTLPFAITEQGIGQLSSVVHSQQAIERSIVIMNAFVTMRRFLIQNAGILMRIAHLERHQIETDEKIDRMNHDRFLIIDDKVYLMGASIKDMGAGLCAITEMQVSPDTILGML